MSLMDLDKENSKMQPTNQRSDAFVQDATIMLAAAVVERSADLIRDGWVKGTLFKMVEGKTPVAFCILGALQEALDEMMPTDCYAGKARHEVHDMAAAFILDEVEEQTREKTRSIPGWNDAGSRTQEEVVSVMEQAAARLWEISLDSNEKFADISRFVSAAAQRSSGLRPQLTVSENN